MGRFRDTELADVELADDRLLLRRWRPDDAARLHEVMRDGALLRYLPLPDPYTEDDARAWASVGAGRGRDDGTGLGCAVVERHTGRLVGSCGLELGTYPEIGYWVAPDAQGHGYAAATSRLLADWGFSLGLARIAIGCDVRNLPSAATALAAGFGYEGVARGAAWGGGDLAWFGRLRSDSGDPVAPALARLPAGGLSDGVVTLRVLGEDDAAALHECDDAESVRWNFTGRAPAREVVDATARRAGLDWLVGGPARLAMVDVATGRFAGAVTLRHAGPPQVGGIGYGVHPAFRGRGFTTRALRLLSAWALGPAGFARLELGAKPGNLASRRAAASAGFAADGLRRHRLRNADGTFSDEVRFALVRPGAQLPSRISP